MLEGFVRLDPAQRRAFLSTGEPRKWTELYALMAWAEHAFTKRSYKWAAIGYREMMKAAEETDSDELKRFAAFRCCWCLSQIVDDSIGNKADDEGIIERQGKILGYAAEALRGIAEAEGLPQGSLRVRRC